MYPDESTLKLWEGFRDPNVRARVLGCAEGLAGRGFPVVAVPTISEANRAIVGRVGSGRTVYYWGTTLEELGMLETLHSRGNPVRSSLPLARGAPRLGWRTRRIGAGDVYMTSVCAVTIDGILVEPSPEGLQVFQQGSMPGMVFVVAGYNKIVDDLDEGLRRSRDICIPQCARLLGLDLKCGKSGRCVECESPDPICSVTTVITRKPSKPDMLVVIVGERLGY